MGADGVEDAGSGVSYPGCAHPFAKKRERVGHPSLTVYTLGEKVRHPPGCIQTHCWSIFTQNNNNDNANTSSENESAKDKPENSTTRTPHAEERAAEAAAGNTNRQVGDVNRTIEQGREFTDTETGNTVHVRGNKVVVTDSEGNLTQFKNSRANTQRRINSGRWVPKTK